MIAVAELCRNLFTRLRCVERLEKDFNVGMRVLNNRNLRFSKLGNCEALLGKLPCYFRSMSRIDPGKHKHTPRKSYEEWKRFMLFGHHCNRSLLIKSGGREITDQKSFLKGKCGISGCITDGMARFRWTLNIWRLALYVILPYWGAEFSISNAKISMFKE